VVNGASFGPAVASGSWISILGSNLATNTRSWSSSDFQNGVAPTQLDGTAVTINGKPAFVAYISPSQVNVQAPDDSAAGPVAVQVTCNGQSSPVTMAQLQAFSPGLFLLQGQYAVAEHADYSYVGKPGLISGVTTSPAQPGETIILFGTGFGPADPAVPAGILDPDTALLANPVVAQVGGMDAAVQFAGLAAGFAGLVQINVTVPPNAPDGDLPITLAVGGVPSQTALVTVAGRQSLRRGLSQIP